MRCSKCKDTGKYIVYGQYTEIRTCNCSEGKKLSECWKIALKNQTRGKPT